MFAFLLSKLLNINDSQKYWANTVFISILCLNYSKIYHIVMNILKSHYYCNTLHLQLKVIKSIGVMDRQDLLRILDYIESTLKTHWADHEGFQNLQERILMLRMILEQADDSLLRDPEKYKALIVQITTLEELMKRYQVGIRIMRFK